MDIIKKISYARYKNIKLIKIVSINSNVIIIVRKGARVVRKVEIGNENAIN